MWRDAEAFLREWRPEELAGYAGHELTSIALPPPLRRYYELAGRIDTANLHLVPPHRLARDETPMLFVFEEQGVYSFGTDQGDDDPPV